jgi:hypothetical protein
MAYALVSLVVLVLGLAVVVASLRRQVRSLGDRLDRLGWPATADSGVELAAGAEPSVHHVDPAGPGETPVDVQPVTITDLGRSPVSPAAVRRVALSVPLIKLAALSYGLRRALSEDTRTLAAVTARRELKRQRRQRGRARKPESTPTAAQGHGWIS